MSRLALLDVRTVCDSKSFREETALAFLESSSFFYNDADETVPVVYRRIGAIYGACANPFTEFRFEST